MTLQRAALSVTALLVAARATAASPVDDPTAGRAVFTGAASPHATSILLNPAALALEPATGVHFYAGGTLRLEQLAIDRRVIDANGNVTDGENVRALELGPGATFGLWTVTSSRNLAVGALLASPAPATPFASGEPALRYHTRGGVHRTTELLTLAAAYRPIRRFYVGGAVSLSRNRVRLAFSRDTALEAGRDPARGVDSDCGGAPCGVENPAAAEDYVIDASPVSLVAADNLTFRISTLVEVYRDWWVGATWRLPSTGVALEGSARVTAAPRDGGGVRTGTSLVSFDLPTTVDAELRGRIHPAYDLHVGLRWVDLSVLRDYDVRLLGFDEDVPDWIERPRGYQDVIRGWAGIEEVDTGQQFLWGARLGAATPSVPAERVSPTTAERWAVTADLGAQLRLRGFVVQLSYGLEFRPTVDVATGDYNPADRLACIDSGLDYSTEACQHVRDGYAIPTAAGSYRVLEHSLRLGLRYDLQ
jgi:hypothetical protein